MRSRAVTIGSVIAATASMALLGEVWQSPVDISAMDRHGSALVEATAVEMPAAVSLTLDHFMETTNRPLFSRTRRPFVPVAEPPPPEPSAEPPVEVVDAPPERPQGVVLRGIAISASGRKALVSSPANPEGAWMMPGDKLQSWTLIRIETGTVEFTAAQESLVLQLYEDRPIARSLSTYLLDGLNER